MATHTKQKDEQTARKRARIERPDMDVISHKTGEQGEFSTMLNTLDNLLYQIRMRMGRDRRISFELAADSLERCHAVGAEINRMNQELTMLLGWEYTPPRRYRDMP